MRRCADPDVWRSTRRGAWRAGRSCWSGGSCRAGVPWRRPVGCGPVVCGPVGPVGPVGRLARGPSMFTPRVSLGRQASPESTSLMLPFPGLTQASSTLMCLPRVGQLAPAIAAPPELSGRRQPTASKGDTHINLLLRVRLANLK